MAKRGAKKRAKGKRSYRRRAKPGATRRQTAANPTSVADALAADEAKLKAKIRAAKEAVKCYQAGLRQARSLRKGVKELKELIV